jgi:tetraacyldisaccharide 4'-kinase
MQRLEALLSRHWWRRDRSVFAQALRPVAWLYRAMFLLDRARSAGGQPAPVPTVVVGNVVVGGVGKTPLVIALVQALQAAGFRPGVLSRGYGRRGPGGVAVTLDSNPQAVGDEPLLIYRRTGAPTWVGSDRLAAARALCAAQPEVDVLVCDDGLQHHALKPDAALLVFDARGAGNGLQLPAGPLREPLPLAAAPNTWVVYTTSAASTPLPGVCIPRFLGPAIPLDAWRSGKQLGAVPLAALRGRPLTALAGIASPQPFFAALRAAGLTLHCQPMPDHADYGRIPPWPAGTLEVITTEKDAVKLTPELMARALAPSRADDAPSPSRTRPDTSHPQRQPSVWVVPLDSELPPALLQPLLERLRSVQRRAPDLTETP